MTAFEKKSFQEREEESFKGYSPDRSPDGVKPSHSQRKEREDKSKTIYMLIHIGFNLYKLFRLKDWLVVNLNLGIE